MDGLGVHLVKTISRMTPDSMSASKQVRPAGRTMKKAKLFELRLEVTKAYF